MVAAVAAAVRGGEEATVRFGSAPSRRTIHTCLALSPTYKYIFEK